MVLTEHLVALVAIVALHPAKVVGASLNWASVRQLDLEVPIERGGKARAQRISQERSLDQRARGKHLGTTHIMARHDRQRVLAFLNAPLSTLDRHVGHVGRLVGVLVVAEQAD